jgi:class 3 adenylate cyclase
MRFCGSCSAPLEPELAPRHDGELRLLTIVFCDLVGSTGRSTRLDPEDLRDAIRRYQDACYEAVEHLGGRIVNYLGDGVLAAFGAPMAREDSARRAVDAALDMVAATGTLLAPDGQPLAARAGVHTGTVVVGLMGRGSAAVALDIIGEAANTAARLQVHAPPGGVTISAAVAQAVSGHFELRSVGELTLAGLDGPVSAFDVLGRTGAVDRLSARAVTGLAPFVGRESELAQLVDSAGAAAQGSPRTVVVVGEAGIGKSRLVREARHLPPLEGALTILLRGDQDRSRTPFAPVASMIERVREHPATEPPVPSELPDLLGPSPGGEMADQRRKRTIAFLRDWIAEQARTQLVAVVVEDLQWIDPSTLEVIAALHDIPADSKLMVLATARPTWVSTWPPSDRLTVLPLEPLGEGAIGDLLSSLGVEELAPVRRLIDRAEGVPLYLEEIAALAARGEGIEGEQLPITIAELLSARLEAAGDRELASDCSVLGLGVEPAIAATMLSIDQDELTTRLDRLVEGGIMRHRRGWGYTFRHGLLRDAAYNMLLRSDRNRLHVAAAETLEAFDRDGRCEEIARHWERADRPSLACAAWEHAGELAMRRNAFVEAGAFYESARRALRQLPDGPDRLTRELTVVLHATTISFRLSGGGAPATVALSEELEQIQAHARADTGLDPATRLMVLATMHLHYSSRPAYDRAAETAAELEPFIAMEGIVAALAVWLRANTRLMRGEDEGAEADFTRALELYDPHRKPFGQADIAVVSAASLAGVATGRGQMELADQWLKTAFDYLALHDEPFHRGWLTLHAAKLKTRRNLRPAALAYATEAHDLALAHGFEQIEPQARGIRAWASTSQPDDEVFATLRAAIDDMAASGSRSDSSLQWLLLARSLHEVGRAAEAEDAFRSLLAFCEETGEWIYRSEITTLGLRLGDVGSTPPPPSGSTSVSTGGEALRVGEAAMVEPGPPGSA